MNRFLDLVYAPVFIVVIAQFSSSAFASVESFQNQPVARTQNAYVILSAEGQPVCGREASGSIGQLPLCDSSVDEAAQASIRPTRVAGMPFLIAGAVLCAASGVYEARFSKTGSNDAENKGVTALLLESTGSISSSAGLLPIFKGPVRLPVALALGVAGCQVVSRLSYKSYIYFLKPVAQ